MEETASDPLSTLPPPSYEEAVACDGNVYVQPLMNPAFAAAAVSGGDYSSLRPVQYPPGGWDAKTMGQMHQQQVIVVAPEQYLLWQQQQQQLLLQTQQPHPQQQQQQQQPRAPAIVVDPGAGQVSFWNAMCLSCCVMWCCCCPIGFAAFVLARTGASALKHNNVAEARHLQKTSVTTSYFGIFVGIAIILLYITLVRR